MIIGTRNRGFWSVNLTSSGPPARWLKKFDREILREYPFHCTVKAADSLNSRKPLDRSMTMEASGEFSH